MNSMMKHQVVFGYLFRKVYQALDLYTQLLRVTVSNNLVQITF